GARPGMIDLNWRGISGGGQEQQQRKHGRDWESHGSLVGYVARNLAWLASTFQAAQAAGVFTMPRSQCPVHNEGRRMSHVPPGWPAERPLAVSVAVMLEGWAAPDAPGIGPMGNPLKPGTVDLQARSWAEYGAKVGAWRLLDLLDQEMVRAVFYTSGVVAERYPDLAAAITRRGHVVAAHGWSQGTLPAYLTEAAEAADIARCVDVLSRTAGAHPSGWVRPRC